MIEDRVKRDIDMKMEQFKEIDDGPVKCVLAQDVLIDIYRLLEYDRKPMVIDNEIERFK